MRSGVRSWEITHEPGPGHVTPVDGKKETNKTNKPKQSLKERRVGKFPIISDVLSRDLKMQNDQIFHPTEYDFGIR